MNMKHWWNNTEKKTEVPWEEPVCPGFTLPTKNRTWTCMGSWSTNKWYMPSLY